MLNAKLQVLFLPSQFSTFHQLERALQRAGELAEFKRRLGLSLSTLERAEILEARKQAQLYGLSQQMIHAMEQEGARAVRS